MMCAGRMESEREVFSALRRIRTASRAGEALELRDEDGGAVFRLVR